MNYNTKRYKSEDLLMAIIFLTYVRICELSIVISDRLLVIFYDND